MHMLTGDTEVVARKLAAATGRSVDEAIREAIEARALATGVDIGTKKPVKTPEERIAAMIAISERFKTYPVLDDRSPDEIIGYDEFGVPR
jgi:antitoxin VapB